MTKNLKIVDNANLKSSSIVELEKLRNELESIYNQ
jgi:hypothetical protein